MAFVHYEKFKRTKIGKCNICLSEANLSWDHVPPKGGIELEPVEIITLIQVLTKVVDKEKMFVSQNGVKYRTICKTCNEKLGHTFDLVLNKFALDLGKYLKSKLYLPPIAHIETKPNSLIRAIVAHLLAANIDIVDTEIENQLRDFVFDEKRELPAFLSIFYWVYPYDKIEILQDIMMPAKPNNYSVLRKFKILKYFPIAYMITDAPEYEGLDSLNAFKDFKPLQLAELPIKLNNTRPQEWPNAITDGNFIILGQEGANSIKAQPRKR